MTHHLARQHYDREDRRSAWLSMLRWAVFFLALTAFFVWPFIPWGEYYG